MSHVDHTESTVQLEWSSCAAKLCTVTVWTCESILLVTLVVNLPFIYDDVVLFMFSITVIGEP